MNTQIMEQLKQVGLTDNEAKVYLSLLEIGQTSAGKIIKKTNLHRSVVYNMLDKLIEMKLVFELQKQKIAYYQPTDPSKILDNINNRQKIGKKLIPQLKSLIDTSLPEINIYEGVEAYRQFWLDAMEKLPIGTTDCVAGSIGEKWAEYMGTSAEKVIATRIKRKIKWQMIVFEKTASEMELLKKYPELHEFRLIDKKSNLHGNFNILGAQSLILHSATEPMIIEIKNKTLVKVFQNIFEILWETGKSMK